MHTLVCFVVSFFILCFTGCSHVADYLSIVEERGISKEYRDVLNIWTRTETVYSQFETRVAISATYQGKDFKNAYLREYDRIYSLTQADRTQREALQTESLSAYREFFFYAYLPEKNDNDFDRQNSIWKVFLVNGKGERVVPLEIRRIEKVTPLVEQFYPYVHKYYGSCYRLKFPAGEGVDAQAEGTPRKPLQLVFTSVLGKATLEWK